MLYFLPESRLVSQSYKPTQPEKSIYAIVVSGDGITTPLADHLAQSFANIGIAAGRARSLSYFWTSRSPEGMSRDLARNIRNRLRRHPQDRIILVGYSFGAGTLPFAINRLPEDIKSKVEGVILLAPPDAADFEFYWRSWLNRSTKHARDTGPEILKLSHTIPLLYLRGETDYLGPSEMLKSESSLTYMTLPGGHDFDKNYALIMRDMVDFLQAQTSIFHKQPQNTPAAQ